MLIDNSWIKNIIFFNHSQHFIASASDEIQALFSLQVTATEEFGEVVQYFGENPKDSSASEIFSIFSDFIKKFEKAHHQNMMSKRQWAIWEVKPSYLEFLMSYYYTENILGCTSEVFTIVRNTKVMVSFRVI